MEDHLLDETLFCTLTWTCELLVIGTVQDKSIEPKDPHY